MWNIVDYFTSRCYYSLFPTNKWFAPTNYAILFWHLFKNVDDDDYFMHFEIDFHIDDIIELYDTRDIV